ncbi:hypothetical protein SCHPADRAFT_999090 [Schizopora paradoxa]|uniref:Uncharacterized protein n=1 Tax=Schizopora paradoxa TaxID=27342 RepID=A0A0H2RP07_9AGAM|nr:hypothetical protein SCHPADRAFT_999090 [Schizopora paradoxa]
MTRQPLAERGLEWLDVPADCDQPPLIEFWECAGVHQEHPFIFKLTPDILLDIFTMLLPSSIRDSNILTDEVIAQEYFSTTAPYNISRVCRNWREFIFSSPSLWNHFGLSFRDPSELILKNALSHIALHLEKSHDIPLFCAISLIGLYESTYTANVLREMERHQKRWRKIQLWFDSLPASFQTNPAPVHDRSSCCRDLDDYDDYDDDHYFMGHVDFLPEGLMPPPGSPTANAFIEEIDNDAPLGLANDNLNLVEQHNASQEGINLQLADNILNFEVNNFWDPDLDLDLLPDLPDFDDEGDNVGDHNLIPGAQNPNQAEDNSPPGTPNPVISQPGSPAIADIDLTPVPPAVTTDEPYVSPRLLTEELTQLEELSLNNAHVFRLQAAKDKFQPGLIPSLRRLTLEMAEDCEKLAQWLQTACNLEELTIAFYSSDSGHRYPHQASPIHLERLQMINITRGLRREWDSNQLTSAAKAGVFVMRHLTCPVLTRLSVRLGGDECAQHLLEFSARSSPPLQTLDLHIIDRPSNGDGGQILLLTRINEALALLPTITTFRLASRSIDNIGQLLEALQSRSPLLLPSLEHLEFLFACAQPSQFVDLVRFRWRGAQKRGQRALKTLVLEQCLTRRYGPRLPTFSSKEDFSQLSREWVGVKEFVQEGLRFEVI